MFVKHFFTHEIVFSWPERVPSRMDVFAKRLWLGEQRADSEAGALDSGAAGLTTMPVLSAVWL